MDLDVTKPVPEMPAVVRAVLGRNEGRESSWFPGLQGLHRRGSSIRGRPVQVLVPEPRLDGIGAARAPSSPSLPLQHVEPKFMDELPYHDRLRRLDEASHDDSDRRV